MAAVKLSRLHSRAHEHDVTAGGARMPQAGPQVDGRHDGELAYRQPKSVYALFHRGKLRSARL